MKPIFNGTEWSLPLLEKAYNIIIDINKKYYHLDLTPCDLEVVSEDQAADILSTHGFPEMYNHWSFGKRAIQEDNRTHGGVNQYFAELIINSNPCKTYLVESNSLAMQLLVIAHACIGHNAVFTNNYLFKTLSAPDTILPYCSYAKKFVEECEERYGVERVEKLLDKAHMLAYLSFDRYATNRKNIITAEDLQRLKDLVEVENRNVLWDTAKTLGPKNIEDTGRHSLVDTRLLPEDNVLYFIANHSVVLAPWEKEILNIVRNISQHFYANIKTKLIHEGYATFWEIEIVNKMYDLGYISDGVYIEFLKLHTSVIGKPENMFEGFSPYAFGYKIFKDIKRICTDPTPEDCEYFPDIVNTDWLAAVQSAANDYCDSSFILQWLSPEVTRDLKLFTITDAGYGSDVITIDAIQDSQYFTQIRKTLSQQYDELSMMPRCSILEYYFSLDYKTIMTNLTFSKDFYGNEVKEEENEQVSHVLEAMEILLGSEVCVDGSVKHII